MIPWHGLVYESIKLLKIPLFILKKKKLQGPLTSMHNNLHIKSEIFEPFVSKVAKPRSTQQSNIRNKLNDVVICMDHCQMVFKLERPGQGG